MGRSIRMFEPDKLYFITNRTLQGRLLMRPSAQVNKVVGGVLARAATAFDVKLYNFVFLSNHYHLIVAARPGKISAFMQFLGGNLARKLGALSQWSGRFWDRRFCAEPILDDDALEERMRYIFAHGVKEGLVDTHRQWPGLSALPMLVGSQNRDFTWPGEPRSTAITLKVEPLPSVAHLQHNERLGVINRLVGEAQHAAHESRGQRPSLGVKHVINQDPHQRPVLSKRSPKPLCHASTQVLREAFAATYRAFVDAYRQASAAFCQGIAGIAFPLFAHRPPLPYGWAPSGA